MSATVDALAAWLTQIWDEEERLAKSGDWGVRSGSKLWVQTISSPGIAPGICASPQHVLARIAADRKILAEHRIEEVVSIDPETRGRAFLVCLRCRSGERQLVWPCTTVRLLAEPYQDRPGFRPEWAVAS